MYLYNASLCATAEATGHKEIRREKFEGVVSTAILITRNYICIGVRAGEI